MKNCVSDRKTANTHYPVTKTQILTHGEDTLHTTCIIFKINVSVMYASKYNFSKTIVAFWVTNPCRTTRKVEQTKMYVCTLEEFILVDIWIHCCASWN